MEMEFEIISRRDQDLGRGVALLVAGAVMSLLKFILPAVAPLALAAYGIYRLFSKDYLECAVIVGAAVLLWFLKDIVAGLLLICGVGMAGIGLFFLIRGIRGRYLIE